MRAFWYGSTDSKDPRDRNWGDIVTPVLLEKLTSQRPIRDTKGSGRVLGAGSILHRARPGDLIWGSGIISPNHTPKCASALKIFAVRGPKTRELLIKAGAVDVPKVYGDPALLAPFIFDVSGIKKKYHLGIIPHYNDVAAVKHLASSTVKIIDICAGINKVLQDVAECESIIASSLHGVVLGDCFAERTAWLQIDNGSKLIGGSFKFEDYFLGTGRNPVATKMIASAKLPTINWLPRPIIDLEELARVCPSRSIVKLSDIKKHSI